MYMVRVSKRRKNLNMPILYTFPLFSMMLFLRSPSKISYPIFRYLVVSDIIVIFYEYTQNGKGEEQFNIANKRKKGFNGQWA
jgi:hypothetical protein